MLLSHNDYLQLYHLYYLQITFASVGGLGKHVRALKEMVVFPLLYPEVFERFKIAPPRGVLFYGPPGTNVRLISHIFHAGLFESLV